MAGYVDIIVRARSADCALAARLSESGKVTLPLRAAPIRIL